MRKAITQVFWFLDRLGRLVRLPWRVYWLYRLIRFPEARWGLLRLVTAVLCWAPVGVLSFMVIGLTVPDFASADPETMMWALLVGVAPAGAGAYWTLSRTRRLGRPHLPPARPRIRAGCLTLVTTAVVLIVGGAVGFAAIDAFGPLLDGTKLFSDLVGVWFATVFVVGPLMAAWRMTRPDRP